MQVLIQQPVDEYIADQQKIAELEAAFEEYIALLTQPQPNPFALEVGKVVAVLSSGGKTLAGMTGTVLEVRTATDGWESRFPAVVRLDHDGHKYAFRRSEIAVIG